MKLVPRKRVARKQARSGVRIDAAAMVQGYEIARKGVAQLATSPLCAQVHRSLQHYAAAAQRARGDMIRSMRTLGIIRG